MSETPLKTITHAVPFNRKNVPALFNGKASVPAYYNKHLPISLTDLFDRDCGSDAFARAVCELQRHANLLVDGKFGRQTLGALLSLAEPIGDDESYITIEGIRCAIETDEYDIICFDQPQGKDLHRRGHFSPRKDPIDRIVVHWGGLDLEHFYNVAMSPARKISSHFGIGRNELGIVEVWQLLDIKHKAWHAGKFNEGSVGVDICQQAHIRWKRYYDDKGCYDIDIAPNPTSRGQRDILTLDPEIERVARHFLLALAQALAAHTQLDCEASIINAEGDLNSFGYSPLVGHHHLATHKWDIAPWWDQLFGDRS